MMNPVSESIEYQPPSQYLNKKGSVYDHSKNNSKATLRLGGQAQMSSSGVIGSQ